VSSREGVTLQVSGLRELNKALRAMTNETPKEIARFHKRVAQLLVPEVKARADARPRKQRSGEIARSVRASGTQRSARILVGGRGRDSNPARVQEFGGRAPLFGNRSRWYQVRPRRSEGWFVGPAIKARRDAINRIYLKALDDTIRRHYSE
jgi:hypothetical protein